MAEAAKDDACVKTIRLQVDARAKEVTQFPKRSLAPDLTWPPAPQRWPPYFPPVCACAWGDDCYGLWIDVVIGGPVQRFRWIEPGEFLMGSPEDEEGRLVSEGPRHLVRLTEGYWLADTECSQSVWMAVVGRNPSNFQEDRQNPVEQVSWDDVQGFLRAVEKILPAVKADLPTEAEWEYACRAGSETAFSWGEWIDPLRLNYNATYTDAGSSAAQMRQKTVPVKAYPPNTWGLYQMHGNVAEWCADGERQYDGEPQVDPRGPEGVFRALRGGAWYYSEQLCRAALRGSAECYGGNYIVGFRFTLRSILPERGADVTNP